MENTIEVRSRPCPECKGEGTKVGIILTEAVTRKGHRKCITCDGEGKLTESRYQKCLKDYEAYTVSEHPEV